MGVKTGGGRQGQQKVTAIPEALHQGGLGLGNLQRILKMFIQDIYHSIAQPREAEQAADQNKRGQMIDAVRGAEHGAPGPGGALIAIGFLCGDHGDGVVMSISRSAGRLNFHHGASLNVFSDFAGA